MHKYSLEFNRFWAKYPKDLCHHKAGSKFSAWKAWEKLGESDQERAEFDMDALIRHDRKAYKPDRWPHVSTFLNQRYWEREIEEHSPMALDVGLCECGAACHGPAYDYCVDCLYRLNDKWSEYRKQELLKLGLYEPGQTLDVTVAKCREWLRTKRFKFRDLVREPS